MGSKNYKIQYSFTFPNNEKLDYEIELDQEFNYILHQSARKSDWTKLDFHKCENCPLISKDHPHCPIALNLHEIVEETKDKISHERATVEVIARERKYIKETDTQSGLISLFGLIMSTSACPHMEWFKPMARFHLPFATVDETMFRVLSVALIKDYFDERENLIADIQSVYQNIEKVNLGIIDRIRSHAQGDADANAIAALDLFGKLFEFELNSQFSTLRKYFE